jgi:hypothetical protein
MRSHLAHMGARRPLLHLTEEELQVGAPTFRDHTHGTVTEVPHVPDQSEPARDIVREIPKADTLDTTRDANLQGHHTVALQSRRLRLLHPTTAEISLSATVLARLRIAREAGDPIDP